MRFSISNGAFPPIPEIVITVAGLFLLLGLWTPIVGTLLVVRQLWAIYSHSGNFWAAVLAGAIASALALLGPGAWSLDALAYGRKRISFRDS